LFWLTATQRWGMDWDRTLSFWNIVETYVVSKLGSPGRENLENLGTSSRRN